MAGPLLVEVRVWKKKMQKDAFWWRGPADIKAHNNGFFCDFYIYRKWRRRMSVSVLLRLLLEAWAVGVGAVQVCVCVRARARARA